VAVDGAVGVGSAVGVGVRAGAVAFAAATELADVPTTCGAAATSPAGIENRPLLLATVSLVITGAFERARLTRFASATSGESSADTDVATSSTAINGLSMA